MTLQVHTIEDTRSMARLINNILKRAKENQDKETFRYASELMKVLKGYVRSYHGLVRAYNGMTRYSHRSLPSLFIDGAPNEELPIKILETYKDTPVVSSTNLATEQKELIEKDHVLRADIISKAIDILNSNENS